MLRRSRSNHCLIGVSVCPRWSCLSQKKGALTNLAAFVTVSGAIVTHFSIPLLMDTVLHKLAGVVVQSITGFLSFTASTVSTLNFNNCETQIITFGSTTMIRKYLKTHQNLDGVHPSQRRKNEKEGYEVGKSHEKVLQK